MKNYIDKLPPELCFKIYQYYLVDIIHSREFKNEIYQRYLRHLQRTLSRKQLAHLGLSNCNIDQSNCYSHTRTKRTKY